MKKGFTLIELLVVISIIMILVAIGMTSYQNAQKSGRDGRRKADLKQIQSALEMYRADNDEYPSAPTSLETEYINNLPVDPTSTNSYFYESVSPFSTYNLCAYLENTNDKDITNSPCDTAGASCGTYACNYGVNNP